MTFPRDPNAPNTGANHDSPLEKLWPWSTGPKPDLNDEWMQMVNLEAWVDSATMKGRE